MASKHRQGSIKRFGARYGRGVKLKFGTVEAEQRRDHLCPYCRAVRVRRVAVGIWECRKCGSKFTGRAYTVGTPRVRAQIEGEPEEASEAPQEGPAEGETPAETPAEGGDEETPDPEAEEPEPEEEGDS